MYKITGFTTKGKTPAQRLQELKDAGVAKVKMKFQMTNFRHTKANPLGDLEMRDSKNKKITPKKMTKTALRAELKAKRDEARARRRGPTS